MANEDTEYLARIRQMSCCRCAAPPPSSAHHHTGGRAFGRRAHDHRAMPLCHRCHMGLHDLSGTFKGFNREQLRVWQDEQVRRLTEERDTF